MVDQTILIIDDSDLVRAKLSTALAEIGIVVLADCGKTGLERALEVDPDLILLDVVLPDIDGFRICDALKKDGRTRHIPVVVLTDPEEDAKAAVKGLELGASDFIAHPISAEIVKNRVSTQLELAARRRDLETKAMVDTVTNCFNRRSFMNAAEKELSRRKRQYYDLVIAVLEIDSFNNVVNESGEEIGEVILRAVAEILGETVRHEDTIGRIDEKGFAIMLPEANAEGATIVLERIREAISAKIFKKGHVSARVTASIGLTEVEMEDMSMLEALNRASAALKQAQDNGQDQVVRA